jgi:hypothetical protein
MKFIRLRRAPDGADIVVNAALIVHLEAGKGRNAGTRITFCFSALDKGAKYSILVEGGLAEVTAAIEAAP